MSVEEMTGEVIPVLKDGKQFRVVIRRSGRVVMDMAVGTALDADAALRSMIVSIQQARAQMG